jgi:hypothetical protein
VQPRATQTSTPAAATPQEPARARTTTPGYTPVQPIAQTAPGLPNEPRPAVARAQPHPQPQPQPHQARRTAVRKRTLADLPVVVHVGLGLALGLAIVGGYWVIQSLLPH